MYYDVCKVLEKEEEEAAADTQLRDRLQQQKHEKYKNKRQTMNVVPCVV